MMYAVWAWVISGALHVVAGAAAAYLFHDRIAAVVGPVIASAKTVVEHAGKVTSWARGKK